MLPIKGQRSYLAFTVVSAEDELLPDEPFGVYLPLVEFWTVAVDLTAVLVDADFKVALEVPVVGFAKNYKLKNSLRLWLVF